MNRPYVLLKAAMSIDGCIDDAGPQRRILSSAEDLRRVDELRAGCDAILVGAGTIRKDNPRLIVRSGRLRRKRRQHGHPPDITKVTLTRSAIFDPRLNFFQQGKGERLVYAPEVKASALRDALGDVAAIVGCPGEDVALTFLLDDLYRRGVRRLLVEGGSTVIASFLQARLVSDIRLAIAPLFIAQRNAPRMIEEEFSPLYGSSFTLTSVESLEGMVVLNYHMQ
ncbi:MAG TPA: dihydrofolate reductase family protein [Oligoflexia bacterium]|nr:dihydrofolate reductase family protein [Oligoflexia bacterium]